MAQIINLNEILGEDIVFDWEGERYSFPADISTKLTFRLADLYKQIDELEKAIAAKQKAHEDTAAEEATYRALIEETEQALLEGFRVRQPELESLPFGTRGFQITLAVILNSLGFFTAPTPQKPGRETRAIPKSRKKRTPSTTSSHRS